MHLSRSLLLPGFKTWTTRSLTTWYRSLSASARWTTSTRCWRMHRCKTRTWCLPHSHPHLTSTPPPPPPPPTTHPSPWSLLMPTLTGPHRIWPPRSCRRTLPPSAPSPLRPPSSAAVTSSRLRAPTKARNIWFTPPPPPRNLFNQCLTVRLVASSHQHTHHLLQTLSSFTTNTFFFFFFYFDS